MVQDILDARQRQRGTDAVKSRRLVPRPAESELKAARRTIRDLVRRVDELTSKSGADGINVVRGLCQWRPGGAWHQGHGQQYRDQLRQWGAPVNPQDVQKGDVAVAMNRHAIGELGGHVEFATGATRMVNGQEQIELAGRTGGGIDTHCWRAASELYIGRT